MKAFRVEVKVHNWIAQRSLRVRVEGCLSDRTAVRLGNSGVCRRTTAPPDVCQRHNQKVRKFVSYVCG